MQTVYALIKPFKYPHPMSFCLPEELIDNIVMCPVPFLMGINKDYEKYKAEFN